MFWKIVVLMVVVWAAAWYGSFTLGGLIHLLPAAALGLIVMHAMARPPDSEFGRWRSAGERMSRK